MTFNFDLPENLAVGCFMTRKTPFSLTSLGTGNNVQRRWFLEKLSNITNVMSEMKNNLPQYTYRNTTQTTRSDNYGIDSFGTKIS